MLSLVLVAPVSLKDGQVLPPLDNLGPLAQGIYRVSLEELLGVGVRARLRVGVRAGVRARVGVRVRVMVRSGAEDRARRKVRGSCRG